MERIWDLERTQMELDDVLRELVRLGIYPDLETLRKARIDNVLTEIRQELTGE